MLLLSFFFAWSWPFRIFAHPWLLVILHHHHHRSFFSFLFGKRDKRGGPPKTTAAFPFFSNFIVFCGLSIKHTHTQKIIHNDDPNEGTGAFNPTAHFQCLDRWLVLYCLRKRPAGKKKMDFTEFFFYLVSFLDMQTVRWLAFNGPDSVRFPFFFQTPTKAIRKVTGQKKKTNENGNKSSRRRVRHLGVPPKEMICQTRKRNSCLSGTWLGQISILREMINHQRH